jgi:hypothetical protein
MAVQVIALHHRVNGSSRLEGIVQAAETAAIFSSRVFASSPFESRWPPFGMMPQKRERAAPAGAALSVTPV